MGILTGNGESLICNLEKHECSSCGKQFIIGTELLDDEKTSCPYCRACGTDKSVWTEDEDLRETSMDLGCLSIVKDF